MSERHIGPTASSPLVLTVPGLDSSGPLHWQTLWEEGRGDCERAELGMWHTPRRHPWVTKLDQAIRSSRAPVILCAHSLGCMAVAWWAAMEGQSYGWPVAGALLVAPPDCERQGAYPEVAGFGPAPQVMLPFPSIVVASSNDPFASLARSRAMATLWGSEFIDAGELGHINADSGLGGWHAGQQLLDGLIGRVAFGSDAIMTPGETSRLGSSSAIF